MPTFSTPHSRSASVLISLPDGLNVSGVTLWALRLAAVLAADGRAVTLALHAEPSGQKRLDTPLPPGVDTVSLAHLPPLRDARGDLSPYIPIYRDTARALARRARLPVIYLPTLLGDAFGIGAALALADPEMIRIVGWQHADIAYDRRILTHYEPVITAFAGVSRRITDSLLAELSTRAPDIHHIPNAVPVGHAPPERLPLYNRPLRLVYTGRLELRQKRVTALVTLSDALARRGVPHHLTLIGDGPASDDLKALAADPTRRDRISVTGALTPAAVRDALRHADCFVLASRYEGLSVAMLEAMAEGCIPIVTAAASGASEAVVDALNGLLVNAPPDGSDDDVAHHLADAVERLLQHDTREMSMNAWRRARDSFSIDRHAEHVAALIDRSLAAPPRAWPADRPCSFSAPASSNAGSGTVPPHAAATLAALLNTLAGRRLLLHGAGQHTIELASTFAASPADIIAITDDDPARWGKRLLGWPIIDPRRAATLNATDVIISSWLHADEIFSRADTYRAQGLVVHHPYRDPSRRTPIPYTSSACTS